MGALSNLVQSWKYLMVVLFFLPQTLSQNDVLSLDAKLSCQPRPHPAIWFKKENVLQFKNHNTNFSWQHKSVHGLFLIESHHIFPFSLSPEYQSSETPINTERKSPDMSSLPPQRVHLAITTPMLSQPGQRSFIAFSIGSSVGPKHGVTFARNCGHFFLPI